MSRKDRLGYEDHMSGLGLGEKARDYRATFNDAKQGVSDEIREFATCRDALELLAKLNGREDEFLSRSRRLILFGAQLVDLSHSRKELTGGDRRLLSLIVELFEHAFFSGRLISLSKRQAAEIAFLANRIGKIKDEHPGKIQSFDQEKLNAFIKAVSDHAEYFFHVQDLGFDRERARLQSEADNLDEDFTGKIGSDLQAQSTAAVENIRPLEGELNNFLNNLADEIAKAAQKISQSGEGAKYSSEIHILNQLVEALNFKKDLIKNLLAGGPSAKGGMAGAISAATAEEYGKLAPSSPGEAVGREMESRKNDLVKLNGILTKGVALAQKLPSLISKVKTDKARESLEYAMHKLRALSDSKEEKTFASFRIAAKGMREMSLAVEQLEADGLSPDQVDLLERHRQALRERIDAFERGYEEKIKKIKKDFETGSKDLARMLKGGRDMYLVKHLLVAKAIFGKIDLTKPLPEDWEDLPSVIREPKDEEPGYDFFPGITKDVGHFNLWHVMHFIPEQMAFYKFAVAYLEKKARESKK